MIHVQNNSKKTTVLVRIIRNTKKIFNFVLIYVPKALTRVSHLSLLAVERVALFGEFLQKHTWICIHRVEQYAYILFNQLIIIHVRRNSSMHNNIPNVKMWIFAKKITCVSKIKSPVLFPTFIEIVYSKGSKGVLTFRNSRAF